MNSKVSGVKFYQNEKIVNFVLYFKRKNIKFVIEVWRFIINYDILSQNYQFKKNYIYKKLSVMIRTINTLCKMLPAYSLIIKKGFDFNFDYEIYNGKIPQKDEELLKDKNKNFKTHNFSNFYSDNIGIVKIEIMYMDKNKIFATEDEFIGKQSIMEKESLHKRQRFLSEAQITTPVLNEIKQNYSDNTYNIDLNLKRNNSKSADNQINNKTDNTNITLANTATGSSARSSGKSDIYQFLLSTDDINTKINYIKSIEKKLDYLDNTLNSQNNSNDNSFDILNGFMDNISQYDSDYELTIIEEEQLDDINKSYISYTLRHDDLKENLSKNGDKTNFKIIEKLLGKLNALKTLLRNDKMSLNVPLFLMKTKLNIILNNYQKNR